MKYSAGSFRERKQKGYVETDQNKPAQVYMFF